MVQLVHQFTTLVTADGGGRYVARAYADRQPGGLWEGWLVFFPLSEGGAIATDRETTQTTVEAVAYWAGGITAVYLEGALRRALDRTSEARLARHIARAETEETYRRAEAAAYETAAAEALAEARAAEASRRAAEAERENLEPPARDIA